MVAKSDMEFLMNYLKKTTVIFLERSAFVGSRSILILPRHCKYPTFHTGGEESGVKAPGFPTGRSELDLFVQTPV